MDDSVIRSMLKWPDIPDVYGWLRLDRRGNWRIRTGDASRTIDFQPISNDAFRQFIGRNYAADARGYWFFQNGPQRVYVGLDYTPFVFRLQGASLVDQCGRDVRPVLDAWLDDEGSLVLSSSRGAGVLDDRDLGDLADSLDAGFFEWGGTRLPVGKIAGYDLETRFGFTREPAP